MVRPRGAAFILLAAVLVPSPAEAERHPLPEALLTESTTDIDAEEAGELEVEANIARAGARTGGLRSTLTSLELEWRVLQRLGLRVEPSYGRTAGRNVFGISGSLALGLWHDFARGLHLQAEILGRTPDSENADAFEPAETQLPFAVDLLGASRTGRWTVRATVGGEGGGAIAHVPVHADVAVLLDMVPEASFGFVGFEVRSDWARETPFVLAPEVEANTEPLGLPFKIGVALPVNVGVPAQRTSYGLFVHVSWVATND